MSSEPFFKNLTSKKIADQIRSAKYSVCFAGPGIQLEPAKALAEVATTIESVIITVCLDFDESSMRLGYGDIVAVKCLKDAGITIRHFPTLRTAFFIVDDRGYMFTPTALYLEAEVNDESVPNALKLSIKQITEIQARLTPEGKEIAKLLAATPEEKVRLTNLPLEVKSEPVSEKHFDQISRNIEQLPPTSFNLARQVRVYEPYLQYVSLSLRGVSIQRNRINIPKEIQSIGSSKDIEGRLKTTFDLIQRDNKLSSKELENALNEIRNAFTRSLGKRHGRVIAKARKTLFEKRVAEFKESLAKHKQSVEKTLQKDIDKSKKKVIDYYLPLAKKILQTL